MVCPLQPCHPFVANNCETNYQEFPKYQRNRHQRCKALSAKNLEQSKKRFSKQFHPVAKPQTNQSVENIGEYNGLLLNFDALKFAIFGRFGKQESLDAMNGHHFENAENKMRIKLTNLRTLESQSE